jgi:Recombination endonuclease VII
MPCSHCGAEKVLARGLCGACYHRLRKTGNVARKNVRNIGPCSVSGCSEPSHAKGFCALHYARQRHPLTNTWKLIRTRYPGETPSHWERFDRFLIDVGERPTPRHQLRRRNDAKPYSKSNVCWIEPVLKSSGDYYTPKERRAYARAWTLNRKFGLTADSYKRMLNAQGGVCAICREKESFVNLKTKQIQDLSVDHDHSTGAVRGLLCVRCNRMLGYARDSAEILRHAISYLKRHVSQESRWDTKRRRESSFR